MVSNGKLIIHKLDMQLREVKFLLQTHVGCTVKQYHEAKKSWKLS